MLGVTRTHVPSAMQQGMLYHSLYAPDSGQYRQQMIAVLREPLDVFAFEQAWQALIDRHSVLRAAFCLTEGEQPCQEVHSTVECPLRRYDWRHLSPRTRELDLKRYIESDRQRAFDMSSPPLMRLALFQFATDDFRFLWTSHHALLDGRSRVLLLQELFAAYGALREGRPVEWTAPRPFSDHLSWLAEQDFSRSDPFWRATFDQFDPSPAPAPTPGTGSGGAGAAKARTIPLQLSEALRTFAREHGLTLNTLFQGAWVLLLSRYRGTRDVVFGATRSCRHTGAPGSEAVVGLLINTVPMRVAVPPGESVLQWLKVLRERWIELREHEHTPLPRIRRLAGIPPRQDLFDSLLMFENQSLEATMRAPGGPWRHRRFKLLETSNYPLTLSLFGNRRLLLKMLYDDTRFAEAEIERMLGHLVNILGEFVADPNARLADVRIANGKERAQVLEAWNATTRPYPRDCRLHQLFERNAAREPHAVAVSCDGQDRSYVELNTAANRLANHLRRRGIRQGALVAIYMERSIEFVTAVLGILKSGAAYLPLDTAYPRARISAVLEDAGAPLVVTLEGLAPRLAGYAGALVCLDRDERALAGESARNPASTVTAEGLACLMYTSGSTGKPKGVEVTHRNVVRLVRSAAYMRFGPDRTFLLLSSVSFDASTFELWGALLHGARCVICPERLPTMHRLGGIIVDHGVDVLWLTASLFNAVVDDAPQTLAGVKTVLTGGEALSVKHVRRALACLPDTDIVNGYGPTEGTTFTCCYPIPRRLAPGLRSIPIGTPISNTRVYVLDQQWQPVPIGAVGELCVGGDGVARGYRRQPALTADKFVPDPYSVQPGQTLYRTGDYVRWREDGLLEFVGRRDDLVKIRGHRVELGEVEAVIAEHAGVRAAAVLGESTDGRGGLTAFVVPEAAGAPHGDGSSDPAAKLEESLDHYLKTRLPEFMVPSSIRLLNSLPLSSSGKLDRAVLGELEQETAGPAAAPVPLSTPTEHRLAEIWREVLGVNRIDAGSNFFDSGGHSLAAMQLIARADRAFGLELPLRCVFDTANVAEMAAYIDRYQRGHGDEPASSGPDPAAAGAELSFAQQRMWFLAQLEPDSPTYHIAKMYRLEGDLNVAALRRSLDEVVRRHAVLRTNYVATDGRPKQWVAGPASAEAVLELEDLRELDADRVESEARRQAEEASRRPFDLTRDVMLRAYLYRVSEQAHVLMLVMHHIASDGWSFGVLARELSQLYGALVEDRPASLPALTTQYADYAQWQRGRMESDSFAEQRAYWLRQLQGAPDTIGLSAAAREIPDLEPRGGLETLTLSASLTEALHDFSRREDVTLFVTLLSAFNALIHRLTGQTDIVVGTPVTNRNRVAYEDLIGLFVNTLVLRTRTSRDASFRQLAAQVQGLVLDALSRQDFPFEKLVEELKPPRDLDRTPLFDVMFNLVNVRQSPLDLTGIDAAEQTRVELDPKFLLTVYVRPQRDVLKLAFLFRRDRLSDAYVSSLVKQYWTVLEQVVANPVRPISACSLLPAAQRSALPDPAAALPAPEYQPVTDAFESWAARRPHSTAISTEEHDYSYAELRSCARALADELEAAGLRPGDRVGVVGSRCLGLVASMLAVLMAGGILVTVDKSLPWRRRRDLLAQAGVRRVLHLGRVGPEDSWLRGLGAQSVSTVDPRSGRLEDGPLRFGGAVDGADSKGADPDHAYIYFTSGSAGKPRGVLGSRRGLAHFVDWQRSTFRIGPEDRCAQLTALSFDASLRDVLLPLTSGATLCLPEMGIELDPERTLDWLRRQRVSVLHCVPSIAGFWLSRHGGESHLADLRLLFFIGEPLPDALVRRWRKAVSEGCELINLYGPTETTLIKCYYRVPREPVAGIQPIGAPLPDTQALVLNEDGALCGVAEPGEIVLRTPFRSHGYLNDRSANDKAFVRNPFREDPADILYRTGDIGRYRPDGTLEIHGRIDDQVKIRGVRIQPAELSTTLLRHPDVDACAVVPHAGPGGETSLAAYVVVSEHGRRDESGLRRFAAERMPAAAVPASITFLDRMPLLANGKVDRGALPEPRAGEVPETPDQTPPETPLEKTVAQACSQVLGRAAIGRDDDFFLLGGHSLLAAQVLSRIGRELNMEIPLRSIFEHRTVKELAASIDRQRRAAATCGAPSPLSNGQKGLWFMAQLEPDNSAYHITLCRWIHGRLDVDALQRSLEEVVRRHEALRTRFTAVEGSPLQQVHPVESAPGILRQVDLRELEESLRETQAKRLAEAATHRPFDLSRDLLLRGHLFRVADETHLLVLVMHHIASDGWSMGVFKRELTALYDAFSRGLASPLPELPLQYTDYVRRQRERLRGPLLEHQLGYWRRRLGGLAPLMKLPLDRPRPVVQSRRGAKVASLLPNSLVEILNDVARREGVTLFVLLLTVFKVLLHRYGAGRDIAVAVPIAGRRHHDVERLIGFFVNTLVIRTRLSGDCCARGLLAQVKKHVLEAMENQDLPFDMLVETLHPTRDLSYSPLNQVSFQYTEFPSFDLELRDLEVDRFQLEEQDVQRDMTVMLRKVPEGIKCWISYNADLLDAAIIEQMLDHFAALLEAVPACLETPVSGLPMLRPAEQSRGREQRSHPAASSSNQPPLADVIARRAERAPATPAIAYQGQELSYRELMRRADRLAAWLAAQGIGAEARVGLLTERSPEAVIGMLGTLRAGAAYVPLDPGYPARRLDAIIDDAGIEMLITGGGHSHEPSNEHVSVVALECAGVTGRGLDVPMPAPPAAENIAYVIYTSGSTGRPKGVMVEHRQLSNYVHDIVQRLQIRPGQRVGLVQPVWVDASVTTIFGALVSGATLDIIPRETALDANALSAHLSRVPLDHLKIAPSHLAALEAVVGTGPLLPRKILMVGGEASRFDWAARIRALAPKDCRMINHYGPSETTVGVAMYTLDGTETPKAGTTTPLGRPLGGVGLYVLDESMQLVPTGVDGELYIGGANVTRGYISNPGVTAERFMPDPFSAQPGARMYRSGDKARWRRDGNLEFLGRIDNQIKIRGFRVEPEEVDAVLSACPGIRQSATIVRDGGAEGIRLHTYVARSDDLEEDQAGLRRYLAERLPAHMVPEHIDLVDALPLSSHGKVDTRALPALQRESSASADARKAPSDDVERRLAAIWTEILGHEEFGVDDNFFDVGGHSLKAMQLAARAASRFRRAVAVKLLFQNPTIAALATAIHRLPENTEQSTVTDPVTGTRPERARSSGGGSMRLERADLLTLFDRGELPPVDSAAIGYVADDFLARTGMHRDELLQGAYGGKPVLTGCIESPLGRIGRIRLPRLGSDLYNDRAGTINDITAALRIAAHIGARAASLTGLIPSATDYGQAVKDALSADDAMPLITTGHGTTVAAVILSVRRILAESGRDLSREVVGVLGLGSIGLASVRLMLSVLPHPRELILCDLYSRREALDAIRWELVDTLGYSGEITITPARGAIPNRFYEATFILGATNVPDVLDARLLQPGTVVVDDSAPHCFDISMAWSRHENEGDILFTEGGVLRAPYELPQVLHLPARVRDALGEDHMKGIVSAQRANITGCMLSGLLTSRFPDLPPIIGLVNERECQRHHEKLTSLSFQGAPLHCRGRELQRHRIDEFRRRYGEPEGESGGPSGRAQLRESATRPQGAIDGTSVHRES